MRYTVLFRTLSYKEKGAVNRAKLGDTQECPPEDFSGAGRPPARTVTTATSPSLLDRFHSSTLKCLNTLRKGCCQAAEEGTPPEHRSWAARRAPSPPLAGRASARRIVSDAGGTSDPGLPGRETRRQRDGRAPLPPAMALQLALPASADVVLRKTRITAPSNSRLTTSRHFRQGDAQKLPWLRGTRLPSSPPTPRLLECFQASLGSPWPLPLLSLPAWACGHTQPPRPPAAVLSKGGHQPSLRPPMFEGPGASALPSNPLEAPDQHQVTLGLSTSGKQVTSAHWG